MPAVGSCWPAKVHTAEDARGQRSGTDPSPSLSAGTRNWKKGPRGAPTPTKPRLRGHCRCCNRTLSTKVSPCPALTRHKEEPDSHLTTTHNSPISRAAPTLSSTTSVIWGSPSGFCMLAKMNWKPSRNSRSYRFFSSGFSGFHCYAVEGKRETLMWPVPYPPP